MEVLASVLCGQGMPGPLVPGSSVLRRKYLGHISTEAPIFKASGDFLSLLSFRPCLLPSMSGPGEIELWPWEGGASGEAGPVENPSPNERGPRGQDGGLGTVFHVRSPWTRRHEKGRDGWRRSRDGKTTKF